MGKTISLFIIVGFLALFLTSIYFPVTVASNVIIRDDFDEYTTNWRFGTQFASYAIYDGLLELTIPPKIRFMYSNSELTTKPQYQFNNLKIKARIDPVTFGSKGWGFWNFKYPTSEIAFAWFIFQKGSPIYPYNGLWIMCVDGLNGYTFKRITGYDVGEWHEYEINWTEDSYDFYIDGENVAHVTKGVASDKLSVTIWNDNAVHHCIRTKTRMLFYFPMFKIRGAGTVFIDYIEITE